jgi:hypothetical protein
MKNTDIKIFNKLFYILHKFDKHIKFCVCKKRISKNALYYNISKDKTGYPFIAFYSNGNIFSDYGDGFKDFTYPTKNKLKEWNKCFGY